MTPHRNTRRAPVKRLLPVPPFFQWAASAIIFEHFPLAPGISIAQIIIHKWSVHPGRRNAVAADLVGQAISSDRIRHRDHCSLAHGISKAVGKPDRTRNGRHVQDHAPALRFHGGNRGLHAVVESLHIHPENAVEVFFRRALDRADVRDSRVVHQNRQRSVRGQLGNVSLTSFWSVTSQAQTDAFPPAEIICRQVSSPAPRLSPGPALWPRARQTSRQSPVQCRCPRR